MGSDDDTLAIRCIDDAIWYEQNGDPANSPMMFGMSTRAVYMAHGNVYAAWKHAVNLGLKNTLRYNGNHDGSASSKWAGADWGYPEPSWSVVDAASWLNAGGPALDIWGWVGTGMENYAGDMVEMPDNSAVIKRGAWVFEATSGNVSGQLIPHGICAAICPVHEPYSNGIPEISGLVNYLLLGFSLEEAAQMSCDYSFASSAEVWGDPFYVPFNRLSYYRRLRHNSSI